MTNHELWPRNADLAKELLSKADVTEWDNADFVTADQLRAQANKLLEDPDHREPPF